MVTQREPPKCSLACEYCRVKKAKCSGSHPCGNCIDHNEECVFPEQRRRSKRRKEMQEGMADRLARMEVLLRAATQRMTSESQPNTVAEGSPSILQAQWPRGPVGFEVAEASQCPDPPDTPSMALQNNGSNMRSPPIPNFTLPIPNLPTYSPTIACATDAAIERSQSALQRPTTNDLESMVVAQLPASPPSTGGEDDCGTQVASEQDASEQEGCPSYLSICTTPAVEWISTQAGMPNFLTSAKRLANKVRRRERLDRVIDPVRTPEPDFETALRWSQAYFDSCLDGVFDIVDQDEYERHLKSHLNTNTSRSWYALRNIIHASGCRYILSQSSSPAAFAESRAQSWKYFENALSVHTDLLYISSDLVSIQALLLMAFHAEALGTPALEYMLLSSATRLAQSMGLHLMGPLCSQSSNEAYSRQRVWWTLYCYEKHIAYRSGSPSAIDDDYISCPIPTMLRRGSGTSLEFVTKTIAHSQISSAVAKQLNAARAMQDSPETVLHHVQTLDDRLTEWRESLPIKLRPQPPFVSRNFAPGPELFHALYLHFCHYSLVIAIHGIFCYPWSRPDLQTSHVPEIQAQIKKSTERVAGASRQIILAIQRLEITAALPIWLSFYFPLVGMANLFVCVVKDPLSPTTASDLSLMDIVVGHFGYLEFISSSELKFPFPREIACHARELVKAAKNGNAKMLHMASNGMAPGTTYDAPQMPMEPEIGSLDLSLGVEDWCTFFPSFPQMSCMQFDKTFDGADNEPYSNNPLSSPNG